MNCHHMVQMGHQRELTGVVLCHRSSVFHQLNSVFQRIDIIGITLYIHSSDNKITYLSNLERHCNYLCFAIFLLCDMTILSIVYTSLYCIQCVLYTLYFRV